ncbi:MAG: hypothetical protein K2I40_07785 [Bifidobacterium castoris]|nr:hypothetical protein [Bifidobacterium castoris]
MVKRITGTWADPLAMTIRWLTNESVHASVTASPPADMHPALPLIVCSLAPGGGYDEYTRSQPVDIDIYAADRAQAMRVMADVETRLAMLQGTGDEHGYVDASELTGFAELPHTPPDIIRLAATVTLDMRPQ